MSNTWKESPAIRRNRIHGTRKMATMLMRDHKSEEEAARQNCKEQLEESYKEYDCDYGEVEE